MVVVGVRAGIRVSVRIGRVGICVMGLEID